MPRAHWNLSNTTIKIDGDDLGDREELLNMFSPVAFFFNPCVSQDAESAQQSIFDQKIRGKIQAYDLANYFYLFKITAAQSRALVCGVRQENCTALAPLG